VVEDVQIQGFYPDLPQQEDDVRGDDCEACLIQPRALSVESDSKVSYVSSHLTSSINSSYRSREASA